MVCDNDDHHNGGDLEVTVESGGAERGCAGIAGEAVHRKSMWADL